MSIQFNFIPGDIRTPGVFLEVDASMALAGLAGIHQRLLFFGQRLAAGKTPAGELVQVVSDKDANERFGLGSMLANMLIAARAANSYTETWAVALADDGAGVKAAGAIAIGGAPTAAGTLSVMIGGDRVRARVNATDTAAEVATALAAAINAEAALAVTAAVNGVDDAKVDLTARHAGEVGNFIDLRANYYQGEELPAGLTLTITAMNGGSGNPDIADALDVLPDEQWQYWVCPWTDAANLTVLAEELADRFGPMRQIAGHAFAAITGTSSTMGTKGNTLNSPHLSLMGAGKSPSRPEIWAAVFGAKAAYHLNIDPARPLQTLPLAGILPPATGDRLTQAERNVLLWDGISTFTVDSGGGCLMERAITTYQENSLGVADASYLDVNTLATLDYIREQVRARMSVRYPRHKLADDTTTVQPGQAIVRPKDIRQELIALFGTMQKAGIVGNLEQFKTDLVVERDTTDRTRVNAVIPPELVGQLRVFAGQLQYRL